MATYVIADTHGNFRALKQCLERSGFNYEEDELIHLGDVADGWAYVFECVEELLKIKNLIPIKGNHDEWLNQWILTGVHPDKWAQGGKGSFLSYLKQIGKETMWEEKVIGYGYNRQRYFITSLNPGDIPESHKKFFQNQRHYYVDDQNRLFIHGGFDRHTPLKEQRPKVFWWDRDLFMCAMSYEAMKSNGTLSGHGKFKMVENFKEVFIGHTSTENWGKMEPMHAANVWNLDTGAGFRGKLTIMNVDTHEYWQSDENTYPDEEGR